MWVWNQTHIGKDTANGRGGQKSYSLSKEKPGKHHKVGQAILLYAQLHERCWNVKQTCNHSDVMQQNPCQPLLYQDL